MLHWYFHHCKESWGQIRSPPRCDRNSEFKWDWPSEIRPDNTLFLCSSQSFLGDYPQLTSTVYYIFMVETMPVFNLNVTDPLRSDQTILYFFAPANPSLEIILSSQPLCLLHSFGGNYASIWSKCHQLRKYRLDTGEYCIIIINFLLEYILWTQSFKLLYKETDYIVQLYCSKLAISKYLDTGNRLYSLKYT